MQNTKIKPFSKVTASENFWHLCGDIASSNKFSVVENAVDCQTT